MPMNTNNFPASISSKKQQLTTDADPKVIVWMYNRINNKPHNKPSYCKISPVYKMLYTQKTTKFGMQRCNCWFILLISFTRIGPTRYNTVFLKENIKISDFKMKSRSRTIRVKIELQCICDTKANKCCYFSYCMLLYDRPLYRPLHVG